MNTNPFREDKLQDEEFKQKYKNIFYKTSNGGYGKDKSISRISLTSSSSNGWRKRS